jgi:hypothetical protein
MSTATMDDEIQTLNLVREIEIAAPIAIAFQAVLDELGPGSEMPDGTAFPMKLEAWPGGRLYRDLGHNTGHLWGHVQVIKPPALLEIRGPLFMSYPSMNFLQYRLTIAGAGTKLKLTHRAFGMIPKDHQEGVKEGWEHALKRIRELAEAKAEKSASN